MVRMGQGESQSLCSRGQQVGRDVSPDSTVSVLVELFYIRFFQF